ncbi:hypothetical protein FXV83_17050 [Bradyrhizobium hipponense]|uniref:Uncharacterized protein n=1 Tax=Bradyrhizobium hipponense TaxID=2605638 RepID=A0A5S4YP15_9BRAD|nr:MULTISPECIES: hypothetical protein [Bradyrhizobium]MDE5446726.1 hypothetical protein [Bradyrhizobium sp. CSA207]TYO65394.1 hypothetical protein FXV83_17050 [Bradyrhizobium hipponense]
MYSMITAKGNIRHECAKLPAFGNDPGTMLTMRDMLTEAGGFQQRVANALGCTVLLAAGHHHLDPQWSRLRSRRART